MKPSLTPSCVTHSRSASSSASHQLPLTRATGYCRLRAAADFEPALSDMAAAPAAARLTGQVLSRHSKQSGGGIRGGKGGRRGMEAVLKGHEAGA